MVEINNRRTDRVLISLPVTVAGTDAAGKSFSEDTTTVTVSQNGAAIALRTELVTGQQIVLRRQRSQFPRVAECEVKEQGGRQAGVVIVSLAFQKAVLGFWDIYFPPLPSRTETAGRALFGCELCGRRQIVHLNTTQLADYQSQRKISLRCSTCRKSTNWRESHEDAARPPESAPANPIRLEATPSSVAHNQRKHRRVAAEIPVCIRHEGAEDLTTTVDISHGGLRFISRRRYNTGSYVQVAIPYSSTSANVFVDARITHASAEPSRDLYHFGIMYVAENHPYSGGRDPRKASGGFEVSSSAA